MSFIFINKNEIDLLEFDFLNKIEDSIELPDKIKKIIKEINVKKAITEYKQYNNLIKSYLKKNNININRISLQAKKIGKTISIDLKKAYKQKIPPSKFSENIKNKIFKNLDDAVGESFNTFADTFGASIAVFVLIFYLNTLAFVVITILTKNPPLATYIAVLLIGPIIEEYAKHWFLESNIKAGLTYTFIFASAEFFYYIMNWVIHGNLTVCLLIARIIWVILHMGLAKIQTEFIKIDHSFLGYVVAVLLHMSFNTIALFGLS